ncbi:MAG: HAMP domain-containing sensor histidine kinase, partial [Pseudomonadota bacterium]
RTPLAATREFVALINDGIVGSVNDEQRDLLRLATDGCDQITALLDDLLDAARMQTGKLAIRPEAVALGALMRDALRAHEGEAKARQVDLSLELNDSDGALQAHADPVRIKQVIANLVGNALKFTPAQGSVRVTLRHEPFQPQWIELQVQDTGCGISPGTQRHIFDRLYQSHDTAHGTLSASGGLGLGLAISSEIVRLHGSELEVRSREGEGATFSFLLPTSQRPSAQPYWEDERA